MTNYRQPRTVCGRCYVPTDNGQPVAGQADASRPCRTCTAELGGLVVDSTKGERMTGAELGHARELGGQSAERLGELLGVAGSTILRNEGKSRITAYLQAQIMNHSIGAFYWALTRPWPRPRPIVHQPPPRRGINDICTP